MHGHMQRDSYSGKNTLETSLGLSPRSQRVRVPWGSNLKSNLEPNSKMASEP